MSWIKDADYIWYEKFALNIIKVGPVPRHVAFIMDGNRRFAKSSNLSKIEGHSKGFEKLSWCLRWCLDVGVNEVTAFAFSKENFKRSPDEVENLMQLATEKFEELLEKDDELREKGVRIKILGDISLLPLDLQVLMAKCMLATEKNNKLFLNIAFAYTSRDEMTASFKSILDDSGAYLKPEDINEDLLRQCLYTKDCSAPDLLIRTSGEVRISDFLMWQIPATLLHFADVLWPDITLWHFLYSIFSYQRSALEVSHYRPESQVGIIRPERVQNFLRKIDASKRDFLVNLANAKLKGH